MIAIEFDDRSHDTKDRRRRDHLVEEIFDKARMPFILFGAGSKLTGNEIRDRIHKVEEMIEEK